MKTAVIATGGKQYVVANGSVLSIEKTRGVEAKEGDKVVFDKVLLTDDGKETKVGTPNVSGASVSATVTKVGKAKKVEVVRYKAKSRYLKRKGHRQPFVQVKIAL